MPCTKSLSAAVPGMLLNQAAAAYDLKVKPLLLFKHSHCSDNILAEQL
jgi:hypothetical protein